MKITCYKCQGRGWYYLDMMGEDGPFDCEDCNGTGDKEPYSNTGDGEK